MSIFCCGKRIGCVNSAPHGDARFGKPMFDYARVRVYHCKTCGKRKTTYELTKESMQGFVDTETKMKELMAMIARYSV